MTPSRSVLLCAAVLVASCGGDSSTNPNGGETGNPPPNTIRLDDTLARTFKDSAQADTLTLSADRVLRIHVDVQQTAAGLGGLVAFKLVDPSTQAVVLNGSAFGSSSLLGSDINDNLLRFYFLPHSGPYLLITTRNPSYVGGYRVRVVGSDPAPEHAKARLVVGDSIVESIDQVGDVDEYYLILDKPGIHAPILFLRAETGLATDTIVVELENGQPYAFSRAFATSAGNDTRTFGAVVQLGFATDSAHIRVRGSSSGAVGRYHLTWMAENDSPEGASAQLVAGDTVTSAIEFPGDVDVFTFSGVAGKSYAAVAQANSGRSSERLEFKMSLGSDPVGFFDRVLAGNTPTLLGQMSPRFDGAGQFTLSVSAVGDLVSKSSYRIAVLPINAAPEHAPSTLTIGDTVTEAMDLEADVDEFNVQAAPGDTLVLLAQAFGDTARRPWVVASGFTPVDRLVSPPGLIVSPRAGDPLRASHAGPMIAGPTGPYKIRVTGDGGLLPYTGQYRLAVIRISTAPEQTSATLVAGTLVTESGDPPGDIDHFLLTGTPGQEVAIYVSPVKSPTGESPGGVGYAVWTTPVPTLGQESDSLGWFGTPIITLGTTPIPLDLQPFGTLGQAFQYRLWAYAVDHRPEQTPATIHIGDVVSNEVLWPAADIDEFTLAASPNTKYQVCIFDREKTVNFGHTEMEILVNGTGVGFLNSLVTDVVPACGTLTTPPSGVTVFQIFTNDLHGGAYELSVKAVP